MKGTTAKERDLCIALAFWVRREDDHGMRDDILQIRQREQDFRTSDDIVLDNYCQSIAKSI